MRNWKHRSAVLGVLSVLSLNCFASSQSLRLDAGYYKATKFPGIVDASGSDNVTTKYSRLTYGATLPYEFDLSAHAEYSEVQMNNLNRGPRGNDGDVQKGLAEVGLNFSREIYKYSDWYSLGLSAGFAAPGYGYNANKFNAPGQGFTSYIFSAENFFTVGDFGFGANFTYKERPGSNGRHQAPEQFIYDLSASYFYESHFLSVSYAKLQSQSGIDLSKTSSFPVLQENFETMTYTYGYMFENGNQIDLNVSNKVMLKNTDGGLGFNLGYSYNF